MVNVSSWIKRIAPLVFDDIHFERRDYEGLMAYGQSKTANCLFSVALDERGAANSIHAFSLHPGLIVGTKGSPWMTPEQLRSMGLIDEHGAPVIDHFSQDRHPSGAQTWAACASRQYLDRAADILHRRAQPVRHCGAGSVGTRLQHVCRRVPVASIHTWGSEGVPGRLRQGSPGRAP